MVICVVAAGWGEGGVEAQGRAVLEAGAVPRIAVEAGRLWADGRGIRLGNAVAELRRVLRQAGAKGVRYGVARTPVAAWAAASTADGRSATIRADNPSRITPCDVGVEFSGNTGGNSTPGATPSPSVTSYSQITRLTRHAPLSGLTVDEFSAAASQSVDARDTGAVRDDDEDTRVVEAGTDRAFLATLGLECLEPDPRLRALLEGVGIVTCGQLAEVPREAVEVRFGGEAVAVWRLARAEDRRTLFGPIPPERPHASLDFVDYVVTDAEQLLFAANALIGNLCGQLNERGEHARALRLDLPLANGGRWSRTLQPARPTASRAVWLRLARSVLERLTAPDAVTGVELRVQATESASSIQGDLFDAGFATASAVDAALARLIETQGPVLARPEPVAHPLPERGTRFLTAGLTPIANPALNHAPPSQPPPAGGRSSAAPRAAKASASAQLPRPPFARLSPARRARARPHPPSAVPAQPAEVHSALEAMAPTGLTLQLLPHARPVLVETTGRRDHIVPIRYRDGHWVQLVTVAGPDRLSGGAWEGPYAREYFRGVSAEGTLVLLFRDAGAGDWYLHGWWD